VYDDHHHLEVDMTIPFKRIAACVAVAVVAICAFTATASAKEGFRAALTSAIPADAKPGTTIKVAWTVRNAAGDGFSTSAMFVRLRGPAGGKTTEGFASFASHPDGAYSARVTVPQGGISGIEVGVAGTRTDASGSARSDYLFPISNPPGLASTGSGSGTGTLTWLLPLLGGLAPVAVVVLALRRRAVAIPQARTG
jgi:hypothetical protein